MATTTNYSWATPDDTALVKDGASAIRTLGSSADTTVKNLNPGTTAGDIDYYTTATTKARVGIGATGTVLTVSGGVPSWAPAVSTNGSAIVATSETTTSTSYTNLTTAGPAVTLTTGTKALVIITATTVNSGSTAHTIISYKVSGATTIASSDAVCNDETGALVKRSSSASRLTTLNAGSNTFTMEYKVSAGTGTFSNREIIVIDMGS